MKKRVLSLFLTLVMLLSLLPTAALPAAAATEAWTDKPTSVNGSGTETSPYRIGTLNDLAALATAVNDGTLQTSGVYFKLTADIDNFSTPIGNSTAKPFSGTFDGDGHTVNLSVNITTGDATYSGLFGVVKGTIKNVTTERTVTNTNDNSYAGGVCGELFGGSIQNCHNKATVTGTTAAGGVCGYCYDGGTILNCSNTGTVSDGKYVGGVCGLLSADSGNKIQNCYNTGSVSASGNSARCGGVCGKIGGGQIFNCYSAGSVNATGSSAMGGGVCAENSGGVFDCYYKSDLPKNDYGIEISDDKMKAASGNNDALVTKLNEYITDPYHGTTGWFNWAVKSDVNGGYPYLKKPTEWGTLGDALSAATPTEVDGLFTVSGSTITLQKDFTAESGDATLTVNGTKTLNLNGHMLNADGKLPDSAGSVIKVPNGANLTLTDAGSTSHAGYVDADGLWHPGSTVPNGCTAKSITGGVITGGTGSKPVDDLYYLCGGGVVVKSGGIFTMDGGTIAGNSTVWGGGVYDGGEFVMQAGNVCNNKADYGGGINIGKNATAALFGGAITGNTTGVDSGTCGGGVYVTGIITSKLVLGGTVKITGNTAGNYFDNVFIYANETTYIELSDGTKTGELAPNPNEMSVGVTLALNHSNLKTGVFTTATATSADYAKCFTPDNDSLMVVHNATDGTLSLEKSPWKELQKKLSAEGTSTITLTEDVTAATGNTTLTVTGTKELDLNGFVINGAGLVGSVITVPSDGKLTITDSSEDKYTYFDYVKDGAWTLNTTADGTAKGNAADVSAITDETTDGKLIKITGGAITGGSATNGGGVYVSGTFNMNGGSIVGNTTTSNGGGVNVNGGVFTMSGKSVISGNVGNYGAGVSSSGTFDMSGDSRIVGNTATTNGGGVYTLNINASFTMSDNSKITENEAAKCGGGVYVGGGGFTMTGGEISGNNAKNGNGGHFGGGVFFGGTTLTLGGTAKITGNTAGSETANNLYLFNNKTITLGTGTDAPKHDMSVGVTTETPPTTATTVAISNASDTDSHIYIYFFADKAMQEDVVYNSTDKKLYLAVPQILVKQTATYPVAGKEVSNANYYTVTTSGFGTVPGLRVEWKSGNDWVTNTPTGAPTLTVGTITNGTASVKLETSGATLGEYTFRITNGQQDSKLVKSTDLVLKVTESPADFSIPRGDTIFAFPNGSGPEVENPSGNAGDVKVRTGDNGGYPVTVTIGEGDDKVVIDPDGAGTTNSVTYTTTKDGTELEVDKDGNTSLTKGGVTLDYVSPNGESIYIKNSKAGGTDVLITNAGTATPVKVSAKETSGGAPYTIVIPKNGSVTIGGKTYKNPSSDEKTTLTVSFDETSGEAIVTLVSGTADVPTGGKIVVDGDTITNNTGTPGNDIRVKANTDGGVDITVPADGGEGKTVTTKGNVSVGTVGGSDEIVLTPAVGGSIFVPGTVTVDVQVQDGSGTGPDVTVAGGSKGDVTVTRTETGFTTTVKNDTDEASTVKLGTTEYTVPTGLNAELTKSSAGNTLIDGTVELDNSEAVIVDGVTVTNTSGAKISIEQAAGGENTPDFVIKTGENGANTYSYNKGTNDAVEVGAGTNDALKFTLTGTPTIVVPENNTQTTEFADSTGVFVTVYGKVDNVDKTTGDVTVKKTATGFDTEVVNGEGKTSVVKVGGTTYTVPASTTTSLIVDSYDGIATMTKGTVIMPTGGKVTVNGVTVTNTTGNPMTVKLNAGGTLAITRNDNKELTYTRPTGTAAVTLNFRDADGVELVTAGETLEVPAGTGIKIYDSDSATEAVVAVTKDGGNKVTVKHTDATAYKAEVAGTESSKTEVKVGAYTYTVPASTATVLSTTGVSATAVLLSGEVELDQEASSPDNPAEKIIVPTVKPGTNDAGIPYLVTNASESDATKPITVTKTDTGANIAVPGGKAFTVSKTDGSKAVTYKATGKLTSIYVIDGTGNVKLGDEVQQGDPGEGLEPGVKLTLTEGEVTLVPGETVYTDSGKVILNSNTGAENTITPKIAISGNIGDTNIPLADGQKVTIGEKLKNGVVQTPKGEYEAVADGTIISVDNSTDVYNEGDVKLTAGKIKLDADDDPIGITGAQKAFVIGVPEGKPTVTVTKGTDAGTCTIKIPAKSGEVSGEVDIATGSNLYKYINNSAEDVTVSITANGTLKTVLNDNKAPDYLPTGEYEGYVQSVLEGTENTTWYIFEDDLDLLLSKAYLDVLSDDDPNMDKATKGIQNTVVLNTKLSTNPTTTGYILTQNCIDIYTAQGNLAKNGNHPNETAYTDVASPDPALYTVDSRERSQQYVSNQSIAGDITSCMVVKISNESSEVGHVEVQAGEAKIKWSETDTTYYVTLTDALYDASHNIADGTGENQYNKHDGKGTAQTIIMNINPYGDRVGMTLEKGDKLIVRGEDVSKEGDSFTAITDATVSMYTAKKNNVYLTAGTVRADNATAEGETANGVKVYVNTADDSYYATSDKSITVTGGKTGEADTFAELSTAAKVAATEANQTVTVGVGTKDSHADTVEFTSATETSAYPICRAGKLDNVGDKVTVKGENKADYTVYSLVDHAEKFTDVIDRYTEIVDLAASTNDTHNMTITNGSGVTSITTAGALSKVTVPKGSTLTVTVGANVYSYVNDSIGPVSMSLTGTGATMNTVLNESTAPTNLPVGTYDAYVIKTKTESSTTTTTYTFQNGMDAIFAKAALEAGGVHTVVINTDLETIPSTTTYIHTKNGYDIYGVEGKLTESGRADTKYTGIDGVKTVDSRERVAFHNLAESTVDAVKKCMMVKVVNGKVYVEVGEARIRWSETDTTYYLTLADALYDAAHNKADGTTSEVYNNNTHDGKGRVQTIIMNTNPYANRENMAMENGDVLMTCGENVYNAGDKYTAVKNAVITMFKSHNDVYLTSGLLQAAANEADATDKTVTVYVNTEDSGYYASSEQRVLVTAGKTADADTFAELSAVARVATTEANQSVTVGIGGTDTAIFTAVLGDTSYPICRIGHLYRAGDTVNVDGENVQNYTVYSLLRVYDKNYKPLEPKYEYAKIFVPAANTGDTSIVNGMEQNKLGTVRVNSAAANDKFVLWMPQDPTPVSYSVAENETTAVFSAPHTLTLASGGYHFIGDCTFKINGVDFKGKDAATGYTVAHRSGVDIVDICDEVYGVSAGKTVYVGYNEAGRTVKFGDKTYTSTNSSAAVMIPGKTVNVDPAGGSDIHADYQDQTHRHFYVSGPVFSGHAVKIDETDNGTVESNPRTAMAGTVVTLTVKADEGYKLKSLRVLDFNGNEVKLTDLGDGKYSFTMPGSSVTVKAEFIGEGEIIGFVDVPADAYYADAVAWAAENDITKGTDAVHFSPNAPVTRAQVVTFLWRAAGKPVVNYAMSFVDVSGDAYYTEAVRWAVAEGITKGTSDTTFSPDKVCTRGQIVTFLARFAGVKDEATGYTHGFTDVEATDYFNNAVAWAKDNGVTEGTSATTFSPNVDCTRAQVVTCLYRWMVK